MAYALAGLEMNLCIEKDLVSFVVFELVVWYNQGGACRKETRPDVDLREGCRLTISRILI